MGPTKQFLLDEGEFSFYVASEDGRLRRITDTIKCFPAVALAQARSEANARGETIYILRFDARTKKWTKFDIAYPDAFTR